MIDLAGQCVLVCGGTGFLGRSVVSVLQSRGCNDIVAAGSGIYDLLDPVAANQLFDIASPDIVIHLAAKCGGIGANMAAPAEFIYDNLMMGLNVIEATRKAGAKLVMVGSVCSYPEHNDGLIRESDIWNGYPEPTNAPYGIAKRALGEVVMAYHRQYGMKAAYVIPSNLYGPGDSFDSQKSHVIPAMIRKFHNSVACEMPAVCLWGTGTATRDFLYVDDAAEAIVRAAEMIDVPEAINIGTRQETRICHLAVKIAKEIGFDGEIVWNSDKPDGQPRRVLDTTRQRERLSFFPSVTLDEGLRRTVKWYLENREQHAKQGTAAAR